MHDDAVTQIRDLFQKAEAVDVCMVENDNPQNDPYPDYAIVREFRFEPASLSKCRLEIWICEDGLMGFGIESWKRIAERMTCKTSRQGFVGGFEPHPMPAETISSLFHAVAAGDVTVSAAGFAGHLRRASIQVAGTDYSVRGRFTNKVLGVLDLDRSTILQYRAWNDPD